MNREFDLIVCGHFAIDRIKTAKAVETIVRLGGPPFYSAVAASRLDAKVSVLSKVGCDFSKEFLELLTKEGIDVSFIKMVENAKTTWFYIEYLDGKRKLRLEALGPKIYSEDIPTNVKAKAVHIAPIANEISPEIFSNIKRIGELVCLDPQGYTRSFDEKGNVSLKPWKNEEILRQLTVFKSNIDEIMCITGTSNLYSAMKQMANYGVKVVIVTMGAEGTALLFNGNFYKIPSFPVGRVVDPTGAGDVFIGAYLAEYVKGEEPVWCACVGSAAASFTIEKTGLLRFGFKNEIYERAAEIYEKVSL